MKTGFLENSKTLLWSPGRPDPSDHAIWWDVKLQCGILCGGDQGLLGIFCYWDRTDPFIIKTNVESFILKSKLSVFALEKLSENTDVMILVRFMFLKLYQSLHFNQS